MSFGKKWETNQITLQLLHEALGLSEELDAWWTMGGCQSCIGSVMLLGIVLLLSASRIAAWTSVYDIIQTPCIHFNGCFCRQQVLSSSVFLFKIPNTSRHTVGKMVVGLLLTREDRFHLESHALFVLLLFFKGCLPKPNVFSVEITNVKKACTTWLWRLTSWRLQWSECRHMTTYKQAK